MLENWFGEILLIILLIFFICPKDIPKIMHSVGKFIGSLNRYQDKARAFQQELMDELDVEGLKEEVNELKKGVEDIKKFTRPSRPRAKIL
jgi:Sec-independent protein translocase protein TatA